jgi:hypothetical protein
VAAAFVLESYDARHNFAIYSLRVINQSSKSLLCRIWIVSHDGAATPAHSAPIEIAPFAQRTSDVPVWLEDCPSFSRAFAEIAGEGVECIVEAAAPVMEHPLATLPSVERTRSYVAAIVAGSVVAALALGAAVVSGAMPRIAAFAVPPMAIAGTTVRAEYTASGAGTLSYDVTAPDGHRVAAGTLADRSGAIPIAIPVSNDDGAYTLQLALRGPLGSAKEVRVLNTVPKGRDAAAITDISVNPVVAKPGDPVTVTYTASGTDGYVRLLGTDGTIWGQRPFSRDGKAAFVVPPVTDSRELRVQLRVTKGRTAAESSAGLVVATPARAAAAPAPVAQTDDGAAADDGANGTFALLTPRVPSGGTVHVKILSPRNGMRIGLADPQSNEVAGVNVGADQETVTLRAPQVALATRYTVVASFTDGFGQESVVEPVTVVP